MTYTICCKACGFISWSLLLFRNFMQLKTDFLVTSVVNNYNNGVIWKCIWKPIHIESVFPMNFILYNSQMNFALPNPSLMNFTLTFTYFIVTIVVNNHFLGLIWKSFENFYGRKVYLLWPLYFSSHFYSSFKHSQMNFTSPYPSLHLCKLFVLYCYTLLNKSKKLFFCKYYFFWEFKKCMNVNEPTYPPWFMGCHRVTWRIFQRGGGGAFWHMASSYF